MSKVETYFQSRFNKLTNFDSIRKLKILEIFQYNFLGFVLVTIFAYIMNKYLFNKTYNYFLENHKSNVKSHTGFIILCVTTILETFAIIITLFYMRKILLLVPSIPTYINKKFMPFSTIDPIVHITLTFMFMEFLSGYRGKMPLILDYEQF